jgi:hypothetical protein
LLTPIAASHCSGKKNRQIDALIPAWRQATAAKRQKLQPRRPGQQLIREALPGIHVFKERQYVYQQQ